MVILPFCLVLEKLGCGINNYGTAKWKTQRKDNKKISHVSLNSENLRSH